MLFSENTRSFEFTAYGNSIDTSFHSDTYGYSAWIRFILWALVIKRYTNYTGMTLAIYHIPNYN